jgi:hypothetical protein
VQGVKFENVAGIDEAKEELMEIVDFLKAAGRRRVWGSPQDLYGAWKLLWKYG